MEILRGTKQQVEHDNGIIGEIAAAWWATQGYTVIDTPDGKAVLAKDPETGEDDPLSITTAWAQPKPIDPENVAGDWYIPSPSSHPRFVNWRDYLPAGVSILCEETLMPEPSASPWDA